MASEDRPRDRVSRKLTKKRKEPQTISLDIPERFRDGEDAQEDVTAPKKKGAVSMNQSIFSMIARAGQQSQTDLGAMQEIDSGESEDEGKRRVQYNSLDGAARLSRISTANDFQRPTEDAEDSRPSSSKHRRALSDHKLLRSLPKLKISGRKENRTETESADQMSSSQFLPPRSAEDGATGTAPDDRLLKHKSKVTPGQEIHVEKSRFSDRKSRHGSVAGIPKGKAPVTLAKRLQQIFEFETLEEVISGRSRFVRHLLHILTCTEYPCWLLQSILLQGYMYITQQHICFYAYIPKKHVRLPPLLWIALTVCSMM